MPAFQGIIRMLRSPTSGAPEPAGFWQTAGPRGPDLGVREVAGATPMQLRWNTRQEIGIAIAADDPTLESAAWEAETLLAQYEQEDLSFLRRLNGIFSGVVVDRRQERIVLFNDRYGLGRTYYGIAAGEFHFASSARALLRNFPGSRQIDPHALAEFLSIGCVLQDRSLFPGISLLPGASCWIFAPGGSLERRSYFERAAWEGLAPLPPRDYADRMADVLARAGPRQLAGGPVGMSLTGGLDSRLVLAWAKPTPNSLPCYTFNGPYRHCADFRLAQRLAELSRQPHQALGIGEDFFEDFPALAQRTVEASDGTMDVSGAVELYVNRLAARIAPIRLTGNYGSEILRRYVAFRPRALDPGVFSAEMVALGTAAAETYRREANCHPLSFIAFKQVPWHHYARRSIEKTAIVPRSPFLDNDLVELAYQAPPSLVHDPAFSLRLVARGDQRLDVVQTDRGLRQEKKGLLSGVEHAWQEFAARAEYAYDYGMPRWLARADSAVRPLHLERLFLGWQKFYHFRIWYRDRLAGYLRDAATSWDAPCCPPGTFRRLVSEHVSGRDNHTLLLHKLNTIRLVEQHVLRGSWAT